MTDAYFSTVLAAPVDLVWATVQDFGAYEWAGAGPVHDIDSDGTSIGAIRRVGPDGAMRQRLIAMSAIDHEFTYEVLPGSPIDVLNYRASIRLRPITDTERTFLEWSASFDCLPAEAARWRHFYADDRFPAWTDALRQRLTG